MTIEERYNAEFNRVREELESVKDAWELACISVEQVAPSQTRSAKMKATRLYNKMQGLQNRITELMSMDIDEIEEQFSK